MTPVSLARSVEVDSMVAFAPSKLSRLGLAAGAAAAGLLAGVEAAGVLVDGARDKPLIWHEQLTERKYFQIRNRALLGGADVVSVGCSHSVFGFDTKLLAEEAGLGLGYNAAIYRAVPPLVGPWLDRIVLPLLRPKLVVWGMSALHLNDNSVLHKNIWEDFSGSPGFA